MAADVTVDSLELQVQSNAQAAIGGVDALAASLGKLKSALAGGVGLAGVANSMSKVNAAAQGVGNSTEGINRLAVSLQKLSELGSVKLSSSVGNQLRNIGEAARGLVSVDFSGITRLGEAIKPLGELGKSNLHTFVKHLAELPAVMRELNTADLDTFTQRIGQLSAALAPLAQQLTVVGNSFSKLPANINKSITATNRLTGTTRKARFSYVSLAAKIALIAGTMKMITNRISEWITQSNKYVEDLNLFTASMGKYAKEAQAYAEKVSEVMGIDPADWLRNQGVFMTITKGFGVVADRAYIMSKNLTQLGYDIASFYNISVEDAMTKLQSGISGELEPLRRLGYDLSKARLEAVALSLGIDKTFNSMTQAEKAQLRYYAIMKQVTVAQGDMARTLIAPANQLRILQAQVTMCGRVLGNIFIPMLNAVLPYVIAFVKVVRMAADALANLLGFTLPEIDYSGLLGDDNPAGELEDDFEGATKAAKKLKNALLGIDELNIISPPEPNGGGGANAGGGGDFNFDLPQYDFLKDAVETRIDDLVKALQPLLAVVGALGTAFAAWKFTEWLANLMGVTDVLKGLSLVEKAEVLGGSLLTLAGVVSYFFGVVSALNDGMNWGNLAAMIGGIAAAVGGLFIVLNKLKPALAPVASGVMLAAMALGELELSVSDAGKNGVNWQNLIGSVLGLAGVVGGLTLALKNCKYAIAKFAAPLVLMLGSFQLFGTALADIKKNGASIQNVLMLIASAVGIMTAAVWAFNVACAANPILGALTIIVGLIGGVALAFKTLGDSIADSAKAAYESTDDFQVMEDIISRCEEAADRTDTAVNALTESVRGIDTASYDFATAHRLVDEIYAISDNANASQYELALMQTKIDVLNGMGLEGLTLSISETTGRVQESREEVDKLIASLEQQAKMEAMRNVLVKAYEGEYEAIADLNQATKDRDAALQAVSKTEQEMASFDWWQKNSWNEDYVLLQTQLEEQQTALAAANDTISATQTAIDTFRGAEETYSAAYADLVAGADEFNKGLSTDVDAARESLSAFDVEIYTSEHDLADAFTNIAESARTDLLGGVTASFGEAVTEATEGGKNIALGLEQGVKDNVKEENYTSIWSKIGEWFKNLFGIHSPSTWFEENGKYCVQGLNNGMAEESGTTQGVLATWAANIKAWFGEDVSGESFAAIAANIIKGFKDKVTNSYTTVRGAIQTFAGSIKDWFAEKVSAKTFRTLAEDVINGFKNGVGELYKSCKETITSWGSDIISWFKNVLGIHSPSKVLYDCGIFTVEGYNNAIIEAGKTTRRVVSNWFSSIDGMGAELDFAVDTSAMKLYEPDNFQQTVQAEVQESYKHTIQNDGFTDGMEVFYKEYVEPTLREIADDTKRQADKEEKTVVKVGNRTVTESVKKQTKANGYAFA